MTSERPAPETGFRLESIFFPLQHCETVDRDSETVKAVESEQIRIGWDWAWLEQPRLFEVAVSIDREPTTERPEVVHLKAVGRFSVSGSPPVMATEQFALRNATAILIPYLRQAFTSLTGNGPFGAQLLQPINVISAVERFDPKQATAAKQTAKQ